MKIQSQAPMVPMYDQWGYPIYNRPIYQPQNFMQQPVTQPAQQPQQLVYCSSVTSEEEAKTKGALIDLDGSLNIFTNLKQGVIYTKQLEYDGNAPLRKYVLVTDNSKEQVTSNIPAQNPINMSDYVLASDFDTLCKMHNDLVRDFQALADDFDAYVESHKENSKKQSIILEEK